MANCPSCGAVLPADAPAGLCPACLARTGRAERAAVDEVAVDEVRRAFAEHARELELGALIGRGGMGFVFRARQARLDRDVAVKVLDPELSGNPLFAERFAREAQTLARLAHPHIVAVHDYGRAGELFYLVLEFVDGVNLRQVLRAGTMAPEQALAIVPQICEALAFAHEHGVVHRDIKPENILLERGGRVKIDVPAGSLTSTGQVLGTLRYMAPEQMDRPLEVDHRADIYSLGVVFYEMLTGEIPMGRFAPPSQKVRIDVRLDEVVLHTLEREPERRYQRAVEVKTDVEAIGAGREPLGTRSPATRMRRISWLAVAAPVVAVGGPMVVVLRLVTALLEHESGEEAFPTRPYLLSAAAATLFAMAAGCALGWAALERIRARWPQFFGAGAALSALWFLPLYALNAVAGAAVFGPFAATRGTVPGWLIVVFGVGCVGFDVWWVARRRRRVIDELERARASPSGSGCL